MIALGKRGCRSIGIPTPPATTRSTALRGAYLPPWIRRRQPVGSPCWTCSRLPRHVAAASANAGARAHRMGSGARAGLGGPTRRPGATGLHPADLHRMATRQRHGERATARPWCVDCSTWTRPACERGDERGGLYPLVEAYRLPMNALHDEPVVFLSHLPPGSQQGPQCRLRTAGHLAAASARQHP